jgi:DNA repair protein RecO (recombination protein O)
MTGPRRSRAVGIVLRAWSLGEADRVFTLFTLERGKLDAVAKGVRRGRNLFAGRLEFMNEVTLELHHGRSFEVVTEVDVRTSNFDAIVAPNAYAAASLIAGHIDAVSPYEQPAPEVYSLLGGVLRAFHADGPPLRLLPRFEMRLLSVLGFGPEFDRCVSCARPLDGSAEVRLDVENGGLVCDSCCGSRSESLLLFAADIENLRALARPAGGALPATLVARPRSLAAIESLVLHHLGSRPRLQAALDLLRNLPVA